MYAVVHPARPGEPLGLHQPKGSNVDREVESLRAFLKRFL